MDKIDSKYVRNCKYVALQCLGHCVDFDKQSWSISRHFSERLVVNVVNMVVQKSNLEKKIKN